MRALIVSFIVAATAARGVDLQQGLVLYYSFDHLAGNLVKDESGCGCDGQIVNATPDPAGVHGGCLHFDGRTAYVKVSRNPTTNANYSVALWFKPEPSKLRDLDYHNMVGMNRRYQIGFTTNGPHHRFYTHCLNTASYGYGALRADSGIFDLVPDRWYHVALVTEQGGASFYLNGRSLGMVTGDGVNRGDRQLIIGGIDNGAGPAYLFPGWIDEVRFYDRQLTDEEVAALFRKDAPQELLPSAPVALGPSYVLKDGVFYLRTEKDGGVEERSLSESETAALLGKAGAGGNGGAGVAQENTSVCDIGFSNDPHGDQDVTYFMPDEKLYVRVRDVDMSAANTNFVVQVFLSQSNSTLNAGTTEAPRILKPLDRARDSSFHGVVPLESFRPGSVWVSVVATDRGAQAVLMRSSRIEILDQNGNVTH